MQVKLVSYATSEVTQAVEEIMAKAELSPFVNFAQMAGYRLKRCVERRVRSPIHRLLFWENESEPVEGSSDVTYTHSFNDGVVESRQEHPLHRIERWDVYLEHGSVAVMASPALTNVTMLSSRWFLSLGDLHEPAVLLERILPAELLPSSRDAGSRSPGAFVFMSRATKALEQALANLNRQVPVTN